MAITFERYAEDAARTAIYPDAGQTGGLLYAVLGLVGEAGELANQAKKIMRDDDGTICPARAAKMRAELGDVLWYVAAVARELDVELQEVARYNLQKLERRAADGTIVGDGEHRRTLRVGDEVKAVAVTVTRPLEWVGSSLRLLRDNLEGRVRVEVDVKNLSRRPRTARASLTTNTNSTELSFQLAPGRVTGLIGPNGAGKTSLIDALSGFTAASGRVALDDEDLSNKSPTKRARAGVARSFQSLELFEDSTVFENISVGHHAPYGFDSFEAVAP